MTFRTLGTLALLTLTLGLWCAAAPSAAEPVPTTTTTAPSTAPQATKNPAATPAWRPDNGGNWWSKIHDANVELAKKGHIDLLFTGDSITEGWQLNQNPWKKNFADFKPANFAIRGDQTQHVLFRLQNGEFPNPAPKVVVLMIGTNNPHTAEETAGGITAIVHEIHKQSPTTKVLLLAIFPRGGTPEDKSRIKNQAVNALIAQLDDGKTVKYLDLGPKFLNPDGTPIKEAYAPDTLHLAWKGYEIWADAITPTLKELLVPPAATQK